MAGLTHSRHLTCQAEIYEKSLSLIRDYFDGEDEDDLDLTAPETDDASHQFSFGVGAIPDTAGGHFSF